MLTTDRQRALVDGDILLLFGVIRRRRSRLGQVKAARADPETVEVVRRPHAHRGWRSVPPSEGASPRAQREVRRGVVRRRRAAERPSRTGRSFIVGQPDLEATLGGAAAERPAHRSPLYSRLPCVARYGGGWRLSARAASRSAAHSRLQLPQQDASREPAVRAAIKPASRHHLAASGICCEPCGWRASARALRGLGAFRVASPRGEALGKPVDQRLLGRRAPPPAKSNRLLPAALASRAACLEEQRRLHHKAPPSGRRCRKLGLAISVWRAITAGCTMAFKLRDPALPRRPAAPAPRRSSSPVRPRHLRPEALHNGARRRARRAASSRAPRSSDDTTSAPQLGAASPRRSICRCPARR